MGRDKINRDYICPICGKFKFSKPIDKIEMKEYEVGVHCFECGWIFDLSQMDDQNLKIGKNKLSVIEYKEWYKNQLQNNPKFNYWELYIKEKPEQHLCPICGKYKFKERESFYICPICKWEDDGSELFGADWISTANNMTIEDYKNDYLKKAH